MKLIFLFNAIDNLVHKSRGNYSSSSLKRIKYKFTIDIENNIYMYKYKKFYSHFLSTLHHKTNKQTNGKHHYPNASHVTSSCPISFNHSKNIVARGCTPLSIPSHRRIPIQAKTWPCCRDPFHSSPVYSRLVSSLPTRPLHFSQIIRIYSPWHVRVGAMRSAPCPPSNPITRINPPKMSLLRGEKFRGRGDRRSTTE